MPFHRNFTYWIDKRRWKYYFLMMSLELVLSPEVRKTVSPKDDPAIRKDFTDE